MNQQLWWNYCSEHQVNPVARTHHCDTCRRIEVEQLIARKCIEALLACGWSLDVNDGEETTVRHSRDADDIFAAMFTTDEDYLIVHKGMGEETSFVWFIYGNSGWDVISDYGVSLEEVLKPVLDFAEGFE